MLFRSYAFSRRQVRTALARFPRKLKRTHRALYALAGLLMQEAERRE